MRASKSSVRHLENIIYQRLVKMSGSLRAISVNQKHFWLMLMILGIVTQNAWAVGADSLSTGVTAAEAILTGSMMRLIVIAGSIFGVIKAYMASSPLLMGGSIGIGIGISLLLNWVKATWAILI
jgi:hypothetical protein